ncbi:hypothetical protein [Desulfovibrio inopinatus]|uniref:hypothetical protein n=1 Tax=Desulfovibrio inopinatus TaxID=102109 RepID=UPI00041F7A2D|nr:hypothetical protein [Desulfovibrio inopinatus]
MIVVDGQQTELDMSGFANLEEILVKVAEENHLENRIVTDIFVNKEAFSEIYPHQAEDIDASEVKSLEIVSVPITEMAVNITDELEKVIKLMDHGARRVADLFRQAEDSEALEVYQDLVDVTRDFMSMIGVLRSEFNLKDFDEFNEALAELSELFSEILEVIENEDWILLSDLLEFEFVPAVEKWFKIIGMLRTELSNYVCG